MLRVSGKRPTRKQKITIRKYGLNYNNWFVCKNTDGKLHLVHRFTGTKRVIPSE